MSSIETHINIVKSGPDTYVVLLMPQYYFDIVTYSPGDKPDPETDTIISIQYQKIDFRTGKPLQDMEILREWTSSEEAIVTTFFDKFFRGGQNKWIFIPVGYDLNAIWEMITYKFEEYLDRYFTNPGFHYTIPSIDLEPVVVLLNGGNFIGARLEKFTKEPGYKKNVKAWYEAENFDAIESAITSSASSFLTFYQKVKKNMPFILEERKPVPKPAPVTSPEPAPKPQPKPMTEENPEPKPKPKSKPKSKPEPVVEPPSPEPDVKIEEPESVPEEIPEIEEPPKEPEPAEPIPAPSLPPLPRPMKAAPPITEEPEPEEVEEHVVHEEVHEIDIHEHEVEEHHDEAAEFAPEAMEVEEHHVEAHEVEIEEGDHEGVEAVEVHADDMDAQEVVEVEAVEAHEFEGEVVEAEIHEAVVETEEAVEAISPKDLKKRKKEEAKRRKLEEKLRKKQQKLR